MKHLFTSIVLALCTLFAYAQTNKQKESSRPLVLGEIHELQSKILSEKRNEF